MKHAGSSYGTNILKNLPWGTHVQRKKPLGSINFQGFLTTLKTPLKSGKRGIRNIGSPSPQKKATMMWLFLYQYF